MSLVDIQCAALDKELTGLVTARGSTLIDLHGIGPSGAARPLADVADVDRFASRDRFASWNGTAPLDASSGSQARHRLSRAGNRRINRVLHIMAAGWLRHPTKGRACYDERRAGGMPSMMAMRAFLRCFGCRRRPGRVPAGVRPSYGGFGEDTHVPDRPAIPSSDCQLVICGLVEGPVLSGNVPGTVQA